MCINFYLCVQVYLHTCVQEYAGKFVQLSRRLPWSGLDMWRDFHAACCCYCILRRTSVSWRRTAAFLLHNRRWLMTRQSTGKSVCNTLFMNGRCIISDALKLPAKIINGHNDPGPGPDATPGPQSCCWQCIAMKLVVVTATRPALTVAICQLVCRASSQRPQPHKLGPFSYHSKWCGRAAVGGATIKRCQNG